MLTALWLLLLAAPPEIALWGSEPVEIDSARRATVCLNGLWRFQPAVGEPSEPWGVLQVPGSWRRGGALPSLADPPTTGPWAGWDPNRGARGWYERTVAMPADWAGRRILLDLQRVSTDAEVYLDGVTVGRAAWPGGELDLTAVARPGTTQTLRVLVVTCRDATQAAGLLDGTATEAEAPDARGIIGDVLLVSRPAGAHLADVFVQPSVRRGEIALTVELADPPAGDVSFVARMLDEQGRQEKQFTATVAAAPTITLRWPWPDARRWDLDTPNLYRLQLAARGAGLDDEYPVTFGFREFWIERRAFYLNGAPIRLRPTVVRDQWNQTAWMIEGIDAAIDAYQRIGFNLGEQWPWNHDERGVDLFRELWAERADRKGFLLAGAAQAMNPFIVDANWRVRWNDPGVKERYEALLLRELRRLRNHPSIVMWATTANFFGVPQDQNPELIGRRGWITDAGWQAKARAGEEGIAILKRHDPTRPVMTHHGAYVGDLHTVNMYLCLLPLQEREEWLSAYAQDGEIPFLPIEFGTPLHCSYMRGRDGFSNNIVSEPLMTEYCAGLLGAEAYRLETPEYRRRLAETHETGLRWRSWHGAPELEQAPAFQATQELFLRNTWRSWRTWGLEGGMVPWSMAHGWAIDDQGEYYAPVRRSFEPGRRGAFFAEIGRGAVDYLSPDAGWRTYPAGATLTEVNQPTLAWIAGPPEEFCAKDHVFAPGEQVTKSVALICDERTEQTYELTYRVIDGGQSRSVGEMRGTIRPGAGELQRFRVDVGAATERREGTIELTARIGGRTHTDAFHFTVLPPEPPAEATLLAWDPVGDTSAMLRERGYRLSDWDGRPAPRRLLVIGRQALTGRPSLPGSVREHVAAGGRLVIFGQDPEWLRRAMGWRVARWVGRRFYRVPTMLGSPALAGLVDDDFRDWRGAGSLVPTTWGGLDESANADPPYGWHWGNRGSVASAAVEKPHHSGWTPLLEGEFDLAYTPLMELRHGTGLAVYCGLDLEARGARDPVAARLAQRIVDHAAAAEVPPRAPRCVLLGDEADGLALRRVGLRFEPAEALPAPPALAIVGAAARVGEPELRRFVRAGGRLLMLPRPAGDLPFGFRAADGSYAWTPELPAWPEARGLSPSDLRLRADVTAPLLTGPEVSAGGLLGRFADGAGSAVLLQLLPGDLPTRDKPYFRYSAWRLTRALCQLLANLGAEFEMDARGLEFGWNLGYLPVDLVGRWRCRIESRVPTAPAPDQRPADPGNAGEPQGWHQPDFDDSGWAELAVPGMWEAHGPDWELDGAVWYRRALDLPADWAGQPLILQLGALDDHDITYFNGTRIGGGDGWNVPRTYPVPGELVQPGRNVVAIRIFDDFGGGGFGGRAEELKLGRPAPPPVAGEELLRNADLAAGTAEWTLGRHGAAQAELEVSDDVPPRLFGGRGLKLTVTQASDQAWHVQLGQWGHQVAANTRYRLRFHARCDRPGTVLAQLRRHHGDFGSLGLWEPVALSTDWREFNFEFETAAADADASVNFEGMAREPATYWFAGLSLTVAPGDREEENRPIGFYHADWRDRHVDGDDPFRYFRW